MKANTEEENDFTENWKKIKDLTSDLNFRRKMSSQEWGNLSIVLPKPSIKFLIAKGRRMSKGVERH